MADMGKIVGAVIAIAVSVIVSMGHVETPFDGFSDCKRIGSYDYRRYNRHRCDSRGVLWTPGSSHRDVHCWRSHDRSQAHQLQSLMGLAKGKVC